MKIAFIHYHLKTGGVTTVIRQQVEAIKEDCEVLILTGAPPDAPFPVDTITIEGLGYDTFSPASPAPDKIAASVIHSIHSKFGGPCEVLHVHNPTLAKNKQFLKILKCLQQNNCNLLLQIHDFAEDGRPRSYFSEEYPSDCHYGVINSRDYDILLKAGLKTDGLHKIFNIVKGLEFKQARRSFPPHVLYPIRAIRRKNIGEAALLSLFFRNNESLVITLPPNSPIDIASYEGWKAFATDNGLKIEFDAGLVHDFSDLVQTSRFLITTSITEGFGFSFIEAWLANKLVWGRKLSGICFDFERNGIRLDHLYERLLVPLEWIGKDDYFSKWQACVLKNCNLFDYPIDPSVIKDTFAAIAENDTVDFAMLDEALQKRVILTVLSNKSAFETLLRLNPYLIDPGRVADIEGLIRQNRMAVAKSYNRESYRTNLLKIYARVAEASIRQRIDKAAVLNHFLNLNEFSLLKWGDYVE
ncbi:MAG: hypothetical protein PVI06_14185 [Desulfobacterales bacterium]|jgi:hypothetical protein